MIKAVKKGWYFKRIALFLWAINAIIGFFLGRQFYHIFQSARAGDWQHLGWNAQWDHALIQDFFFVQREALDLLKYEVVLLVPFFIMLKIFMAGGILYCGKMGERSWSAFWYGGSRLFWPFLLNFLIFLVLVVIAALLIALPGIGWAYDHLENVGDERGSFKIILATAVLFIGAIIYLIGSNSASKAILCKMDTNIWKAVWRGLGLGYKRSGKFLEFFFSFLILSIIGLFLVQWTVQVIGYQTWIGLFVIIGIQQAFIFFRGLFRMMYLYGIQNVVDDSTTF